MSSCDCSEAAEAVQKKTLVTLLVVNGGMFVCEGVVGIMAQSTGVLADSLDMLADALVYGIALFAIGRSPSVKTSAARWSGWMQIGIALSIFADIARRGLVGSEPVSLLMFLVSCVALAANLFCLSLIARHREGEVHMRASWIFSKNDVIANLGVILASALVWFTGTRWPDLAIGALITAVVLNGGLSILREAAAEARREARA